MRLVAVTFASILFASASAAAQQMDISTVHGNETGCKVENGGEYLSDDKILLRPNGIEGHESFCEFVQVLPASDGASVTTSLCQSEGSYEVRTHVISAPDLESKTRLIFFSDGAFLAEVGPCS